jgi:hypothetical protein
MCWQYSFLWAFMAAPLGGSLAVLSAALLLYLRNSEVRSRPFSYAEREAPKAMG